MKLFGANLFGDNFMMIHFKLIKNKDGIEERKFESNSYSWISFLKIAIEY